MARCNYCTLQAIKAKARREHKRVTVLPSDPDEDPKLDPPGYEVFVHPAGVSEQELREDKERSEGGASKYWIAWLWEVTDHCVC